MNHTLKWIIKPLSLYDIQNADLSYLKYVIKENSIDKKTLNLILKEIKDRKTPKRIGKQY